MSDAESACLVPYRPSPKPIGRPRLRPLRKILDGTFSAVRTGCQWRLLPYEFAPRQTVYHYFRLWRLDGTWERMPTALQEQLRVAAARDPQPSAGIIDSPSVKTTGVGGGRDYDGAKKLSGRKRHLLVDTQGRVLRAMVHSAATQDRAAVPLLLDGAAEQFPRLPHLWADQGYIGTGKAWIEEHLGWTVEIVQHPANPRGEWVALGTGSDLRPFA